jgi:Domain of unknown function (DUF6927)
MKPMGWTFAHKPQGQSVVDFFRLAAVAEGVRWQLLEGAATLKEAYLAWQKPDGTVVASVCLLCYRNHDYLNFGYKEMSEGAGHGLNQCPTRILNLLTPTADEASLAWRESCRAYHARMQEKRLLRGQRIRFVEPIRFKNGELLDLFSYEPEGRSPVFRSPETDRLYRIPDYKEREWTRE